MDYSILLREVNHRCSNDLQLVIGLLMLASRRTDIPETRDTLVATANRIHALARARASMLRPGQRSLTGAMRDLVAALQILAEPRGVVVSLEAADAPERIDDGLALALAMSVNELVTNALKHAYDGHDGGHVRIAIDRLPPLGLVVMVDDDGLPFDRHDAYGRPEALGLDLVRRLVGSFGGSLALPDDGSKQFVIRIENAG